MSSSPTSAAPVTRPAALWHRRDVWSWCLYDWANSGFVTSVITVVMPVYFLSLLPNRAGPLEVSLGPAAFRTNGDALFGYVSSAYMLAAALVAPLAGAVADLRNARRRFLAFAIVTGCILTAGLAAVGPGQFLLCALLFAGAAFAWNCANAFYDSLLPVLTDRPAEMDAVSSAGYAAGYLGGGLLLTLNLAMVQRPAWFGFSGAGPATSAVFLTVAAWWFVFSLPVLFRVPEPVRSEALPGRSAAIRQAAGQLANTVANIRAHGPALRMLAAFMLYNTGVGTIITIAALFGKAELGLSTGTLIGCILMIQLVGVPAAFGFIRLSRLFGPRRSILIGIAVYIGTLLLAWRMTTEVEFWLLGVLVGLVQGGTQALSRSLYGALIPAQRSAEFFGFFSIFSKVGTFLGPLTFSLVRDATGSSRLGILALAVFFVLGAAVLLTVPNPRPEPPGRSPE